MLSISSVYNDVALDAVNSAENGQLSYKKFNRLSRRAELKMLNYLGGDIENMKPPIPYDNQLLRDILAPMVTPYPVQVVSGKITRPIDYYSFDSMVLLGNYQAEIECEEESEIVEGCNTVIEVLDSSTFDLRCKTFIEGLEPSFNKPIAKMVGREFQFMPVDLGSVRLQYVRYPIFGIIVSKLDTVYNEQVVDEALSTNYEYDEFARDLLVYYIVKEFGVGTRETALLQANELNGKSARP